MNDDQTQPARPTAEAATSPDWTVREGTPVITFDGEKIGEVENTTGGYLLVKKGFLFPKEYAIPAAAIENVGPDAVYLNVTKEIARSQGWDEPLTPETANADQAQSHPLPITPAAAPPPTVVTGDPHVEAPLIGTFSDDQAGTYTDTAADAAADAAAGTEQVRTRDDAVEQTATSAAGFGADDAEEIPANPIASGIAPASPAQEPPMSTFETDDQNARDAALAGHDEAMDEGIATAHTLRTPSPLPAMDAPLDADEPAPADGRPEDAEGATRIGTDAAVANEALDPLISEDAEEDPDPALPAPSGPADRV